MVVYPYTLTFLHNPTHKASDNPVIAYNQGAWTLAVTRITHLNGTGDTVVDEVVGSVVVVVIIVVVVVGIVAIVVVVVSVKYSRYINDRSQCYIQHCCCCASFFFKRISPKSE